MSWINLVGYLERFKNIKPPREFVRGAVLDVMKEVTCIELKDEQVECRHGIVRIKTGNAMEKNHIFMCKEKILIKFREKIGPRAPMDLMFG